MKREIEFIKSMTEKLRRQGDISADEATYIFLLAVVTHAYEMGALEGRYKNSFGGKFDCTELSSALGEWYDEVFRRMPDIPKYHNFITSIPSRKVCPITKRREPDTSYMIKTMDKVQGDIENKMDFANSSCYCKSEKTTAWVKNNVPLSFDVIYHYGPYGSRYSGLSFTRLGLLGALPTYERKVTKEKIQTLWDIDVPFLRTALKEEDVYLVICPPEYKDVLDAVADGMPIPEIPPEKAGTSVPRDIAYINSLTARLPFQDITESDY